MFLNRKPKIWNRIYNSRELLENEKGIEYIYIKKAQYVPGNFKSKHESKICPS